MIGKIFKPKRGVPHSVGEWIFEPKLDGQRCIIIASKETRFLQRDGLDFKRWGQKVEFLKQFFKGCDAVFDSEFMARGDNLCMVLFDMLFINGRDIREEPLMTRKELLRQWYDEWCKRMRGYVKLISYYEVEGVDEMFMLRDRFKNNGWEGFKAEGLVAKLKDSPYKEGYWLKMK